MDRRLLSVGAALSVSLLWFPGASARADDSFLRYQKASGLDESAAAELEQKSQKHPKDWKAHVDLLGYWTRNGAADPATAKPARARHLLWLIEHRPEASVLAHPQAGTVNTRDHPLADRQTYDKAKALWMDHLKHPNKVAPLHAAVFLSRQDPQAAFDALSRLPKKGRTAQQLLGEICAAAYVGALGLDHSTEFALWLDPELPNSKFTDQCKQIIESAGDADLLRGFVVKAARDGSEFFLDGKLDWDYAGFLRSPAERAATADTKHPLLRVIPGLELPDPQDAGPRIVTISGEEMKIRLIKSVPPVYPPLERSQGVTGSAHLLVTIDPNGDVVQTAGVAGPPGLQAAAAAAVSQWQYQGVERLGRPYFVLTYVQVNFKLSRR